jgi:hypothetical protein
MILNKIVILSAVEGPSVAVALAFASRYPKASAPGFYAFASRYPKASALGLICPSKNLGFSPWGMPSFALPHNPSAAGAQA